MCSAVISLMTKPSPAALIAASNNRRHSSLPYLFDRASQAFAFPGVEILFAPSRFFW
jgi:hypothetical protein